MQNMQFTAYNLLCIKYISNYIIYYLTYILYYAQYKFFDLIRDIVILSKAARKKAQDMVTDCRDARQ